MDESCSVKEIFKNEITPPKIIRISKVFTLNNRHPENIMILTKGNNKIQCNLTNEINHGNILNILKTAQNSPNNENLKTKLFYPSLKYPNTEDINANINNLHKPIINEKIQKESNNILQEKINIDNNNTFFRENIDDINITNLEGLILPKKEMKTSIENKKSFPPGMKLIDSKDSERQLLKKRTLNSNNEIKNENLIAQSNNNIFYKKTNLNQILSKKQITYENNMNINIEGNNNNIDNNNLDKIPGIIHIRNNKNLLGKGNLDEIIDKFSKTNFIDDKQCIICERTYSSYSKKIFSARCNIHFFCKECLKLYFQNLIDKGIKKKKCPIYKCKYDIEDNILQQILDIKYSSILFAQNNNINEEKNTIFSEKKYENKYNNFISYQNKNVFQYNPQLNLYKIKKLENEYCTKCHELSLFCMTFTLFNKCLNCGYKSCKYCDKAFTNYHLIINDPRHCKVYYRKSNYFDNNNTCYKFVIELLYVVGIYFILHIYFLTKNKMILLLFGIDKNKYNNNSYMIFIINLFRYFFNFLFYLIILPFLIIFIPFFPIFIALVDGF